MEFVKHACIATLARERYDLEALVFFFQRVFPALQPTRRYFRVNGAVYAFPGRNLITNMTAK